MTIEGGLDRPGILHRLNKMMFRSGENFMRIGNIQICWGICTYGPSANSGFGYAYYHVKSGFNFPAAFKNGSTPKIQMTLHYVSGSGVHGVDIYGVTSTGVNGMLVWYSRSGSWAVYVDWLAVGVWK